MLLASHHTTPFSVFGTSQLPLSLSFLILPISLSSQLSFLILLHHPIFFSFCVVFDVTAGCSESGNNQLVSRTSRRAPADLIFPSFLGSYFLYKNPVYLIHPTVISDPKPHLHPTIPVFWLPTQILSNGLPPFCCHHHSLVYVYVIIVGAHTVILPHLFKYFFRIIDMILGAEFSPNHILVDSRSFLCTWLLLQELVAYMKLQISSFQTPMLDATPIFYHSLIISSLMSITPPSVWHSTRWFSSPKSSTGLPLPFVGCSTAIIGKILTSTSAFHDMSISSSIYLSTSFSTPSLAVSLSELS